MKALYTFLFIALLVFGGTLLAQNNTFNYQAVVRDANGAILENQSVSVTFSIREGSTSGAEVYAESHSTTTNDQGLVNLSIGSGTPTMGAFTDVKWEASAHFLNVNLNGTDLGTSEFKSVPYAATANSGVRDFQVGSFDVDQDNSLTVATAGGNQYKASINLKHFSDNYGWKLESDEISNKFHIKNSFDGLFLDASRLSIDFDGNVGINTENPTARLEVNGSVKVSEETIDPGVNTIYGNSLPLAYGVFAGDASIIFHQYGITSITKTATGSYSIILDNGFTGNAVVIANSSQGSPRMMDGFASGTSNEVIVRAYDPSGTLVDTQFSVTVFGNAQ